MDNKDEESVEARQGKTKKDKVSFRFIEGVFDQWSHGMTEAEALLLAKDLKHAAEAGVLHSVLQFAMELFHDDPEAPRGLVKVFRRAAADVDEIIL